MSKSWDPWLNDKTTEAIEREQRALKHLDNSMSHQFDITEIKSIIEIVRAEAKNAGYDYPPVNSVCDEIIRQLEKKSKKEQEA